MHALRHSDRSRAIGIGGAQGSGEHAAGRRAPKKVVLGTLAGASQCWLGKYTRFQDGVVQPVRAVEWLVACYAAAGPGACAFHQRHFHDPGG